MSQLSLRPDWPLILAYHSVNDERRDGLAVRVSAFAGQMKWLARHGYRTVTLTDFVREPVEGRVAIITFDDGYGDNYRYAFPILRLYGFVATVFLVSDYVGQNHVYWWDRQHVTNEQVRLHYCPLSWRQIEEMARYGIEFGSHTCTHPQQMTMLPSEQRWQEIKMSRVALQRRLGTPVTSFCYPRGDVDQETMAMVERAGYQCAVVTPPRPDIPITRFSMRRMSMYRENGSWNFRLKMTALFRRHYDDLQRLRQSVALRQAGETSRTA